MADQQVSKSPMAKSPSKSPSRSPQGQSPGHQSIVPDTDDGTIEAEIFDADSAISAPLTDGLTSLRSSVRQFQMENGRTYHSMSQGKYMYPNDDAENERLDLQHNVWLLTLRGELALCPKGRQPTKRVLDCGTGTGIWAIEYADEHPEAQVLGFDLSPIQPNLVPPNCTFEVDDMEKDWTWTEPFDFIFSRALAGSLADYQDFVNKAFANLEPGGWLEMQDFATPYASDDGTLDPDSELGQVSPLSDKAVGLVGRRLNAAPEYKDMMAQAGFVDIVERRFKWPLNSWPVDPYYKEIGSWTLANLDGGLEGLLMGMFTRQLGWTPEETILFAAKARQQLRDRRIHGYVSIFVVYGRKPEEAE